ncbi:hypothetical protein [Bradyrhizobium sp. STM 3561]|uniref:hypothetical protein n=1 Tax=unclassified Bradyrhizobium TaxID=2631580 RepID=UPI00388E9303
MDDAAVTNAPEGALPLLATRCPLRNQPIPSEVQFCSGASWTMHAALRNSEWCASQHVLLASNGVAVQTADERCDERALRDLIKALLMKPFSLLTAQATQNPRQQTQP